MAKRKALPLMEEGLRKSLQAQIEEASSAACWARGRDGVKPVVKLPSPPQSVLSWRVKSSTLQGGIEEAPSAACWAWEGMG